MIPTVYLAGPITGMTEKDARDWRVDPLAKLAAMGMRGIDPLRSEPPDVSGVYGGTYADLKFGTSKAIASKNIIDVKSADIVLCYMPQHLSPTWPSVGTLAELFMAHAWGIPTVVVTDEPRLAKHPLVQHAASWMLPSLDDALELIDGLFGAYAEN